MRSGGRGGLPVGCAQWFREEKKTGKELILIVTTRSSDDVSRVGRSPSCPCLPVGAGVSTPQPIRSPVPFFPAHFI